MIESDSRDELRCAVFQGEVRFEDFTLRVGKSARVVVPPGDVLIRLYDSKRTRVERSIHVERGDGQKIRLAGTS